MRYFLAILFVLLALSSAAAELNIDDRASSCSLYGVLAGADGAAIDDAIVYIAYRGPAPLYLIREKRTRTNSRGEYCFRSIPEVVDFALVAEHHRHIISQKTIQTEDFNFGNRRTDFHLIERIPLLVEVEANHPDGRKYWLEQELLDMGPIWVAERRGKIDSQHETQSTTLYLRPDKLHRITLVDSVSGEIVDYEYVYAVVPNRSISLRVSGGIHKGTSEE